MVSCLLFHLCLPHCESGENAIEFFGSVRTMDGEGVTIPSQKRYTRWYAQHFASEARPLQARAGVRRSV